MEGWNTSSLLQVSRSILASGSVECKIEFRSAVYSWARDCTSLSLSLIICSMQMGLAVLLCRVLLGLEIPTLANLSAGAQQMAWRCDPEAQGPSLWNGCPSLLAH